MNPINVKQMEQLRERKFKVSIRHLRSIPEVKSYIHALDAIGVPEGELSAGNLNGINVSAVTVCEIMNKGGKMLSTGIAACSENDQFERGIGSSLAFKRAISALPLDRSERRELLCVT